MLYCGAGKNEVYFPSRMAGLSSKEKRVCAKEHKADATSGLPLCESLHEQISESEEDQDEDELQAKVKELQEQAAEESALRVSCLGVEEPYKRMYDKFVYLQRRMQAAEESVSKMKAQLTRLARVTRAWRADPSYRP